MYERKAFALQCNFSELCVTNSAQIPIFTMGQMSENKYARAERFQTFEGIILKQFEKLEKYKDLCKDH